jgi:hypothetical protein
VWPAALVATLVIASRRRVDVVTVAVALSVGILGVSIIAGSGLNALGFIAEQSDRGLQVEAPLAVAWLWLMVGGVPGIDIDYDRAILTFQVEGPGADAAAALTTPVMALGVAAVVLVGVRAARRGATFGRLVPPLALALVVVLMLANKVGSPQFVTWLAAPVILGIVLGPRRFAVPALLAAGVALLTQVIYPYWYGWLLVAHPGFVLVLTVKVLLLVLLAVWGIRAVWQAGTTGERRGLPTV